MRSATMEAVPNPRYLSNLDYRLVGIERAPAAARYGENSRSSGLGYDSVSYANLRRLPALLGYRYGVALLFVGTALVLSLLVQPSLPDGFLVFFLSAVMLAGWFGRTGAGLFAVVVSMPAVGYTGQRLRGNGFVPLFRPHSVRRENPVAESLTLA